MKLIKTNNKLKTKYKSVFSALFCIILFINSSFAQKLSKEEKNLYKKAKNQLINEDFKTSKSNYLKLVELKPNNVTYNFEGGLSYYFSDFERTKSIPLFESAIENFKDDTIPETYYYLANAYHLNGEFEESKEAFKKFKPFIQKETEAGKELLKKSEYNITSSNNADKYLAKIDDNIKVINIGNVINSASGEYAPVVKKGSNIMLFTSRRIGDSKKNDIDLLPFEDVYVAKKENDSWQLLTDQKEINKYIPLQLNSKKHDAGIIYSSDGQTLYTYKKGGIWKSNLEHDKWSNLVKLDKNINSNKHDIASVTLTKDGNTIYFVSNQKDGLGGKDIFKSTKNSEGNWGKAENLGENINTVSDEDAPFLSEDDSTLYFASKGHKGIGGYDIFKSQRKNNSWSKPENLGIPINSPADDIYLVIDKDNKKGFLSSSREGGFGGMDIYSLCMNCPTETINNIDGLIVDNNNFPINSGNIKLKNINSTETIENYLIQEGVFKFKTSRQGKHNLEVDIPNYEKQTVSISLSDKSSTSDISLGLSQFQKDDKTYQIITAKSISLGLNISDTIKVDKLVALIDTNNNSDNSNTSNSIIASYQENFSYNKKKISLSNSEFKEMIEKAVNKVGKIYIEIESSASKVPTKSFKTNIQLASLRGDENKVLIVEALKEKGVKESDIEITSINSFVSGPIYKGDYKNVEKYQKYQYIKITIK